MPNKPSRAEVMALHEKAKKRVEAKLRARGMSEEFIAKGEDAMEYIDPTENNQGELVIALQNIRRAMERGSTYERAVMSYGIRGHPYFREFWPETKWWGDVRWARELQGLPVD